jgi:peptidoglycan hydrolase CwlO-like protein
MYNDNVSLISSHVLGTKSMADINDKLSVYSRSICGSRMFPNDNESVLYDLEQRQTQAIQEKINRNDNEIKKYTEKIQKLKEQILHCEELTKNYSRFIEKEERISEELRIMINYLHLHRENNNL